MNNPCIPLGTLDEFVARHIGPREGDIAAMLALTGHDSLDALVDSVIPASIKGSSVLTLTPGQGEAEALAALKRLPRTTSCIATTSARAITLAIPRLRFCATCWRTRPGTPRIPRTSRKFPKAAWKHC